MIMKQVSKEDFFHVINPLNVHPRVDVSSLRQRHHVSIWKMLDGTNKVIGRTESDGWGIDETKFYLQGGV